MNASEETKELMQKYIKEHGIAIMGFTWKTLEEAGHKVKPSMDDGNIWNAALEIINGNHVPDGDSSEFPVKSKFMFYNTFLEILTVDRDDDPLVFDPEILSDKEHIFHKISEVLSGRLTLLIGLLDGKSTEEIYNENPGQYERIRKKEVSSDEPQGFAV